MAFKFIHTADLHFDSPLRSLALKDPDLADLVSTASRKALGRIVDLCLRARADALLVSGDAFDGQVESAKTAVYFAEMMRKLESVRVFMILGNHDAESKISKAVPLPPNVHVFKGRAGIVELPEHGAAIHGISFGKRHAPESLLPKFHEPRPGLFNVGMLHTSLSGSDAHDRYAPCSLGDLRERSFDYWALGHIHKRQIHSEDPWIVMPGIPQGRDIGESGRKSVTEVRVDDGGSIQVEEHPVAYARFERVDVDVTGCEQYEDIRTRTEAALERAQREADAQHLIARIEYSGRTSMHWYLKANVEMLLENAKFISQGIEGCWVEKVVSDAAPAGPVAPEGDPVIGLQEIIAEWRGDPAFLNGAKAEFEALIKQLPTSLGRKWSGGEGDTLLRNLIDEGCSDVIAALKADAGG